MKLGKSYRKIFPAMLFVNHVLHEFKNVKFDVLWTSLETQRKCGMRAFSFAGKQKLKSTLTDKSVTQKVIAWLCSSINKIFAYVNPLTLIW